MKRNSLIPKFILMISIVLLVGLISSTIGLNGQQALAVSIFMTSVLGTLFFWDFRLAFVFLGIATLLITKTIDLENAIKFASLEIILFLVGMMVLVGLLKEVGVFAWLISLILRIKNLTARKFIFAISIISALLACAVDEVTSIIFIVAVVLEMCDYFEIDPIPYIIISVLATNIGSSGTVLGNPIGILIATRAGLTFEDFLIHAFPLMLLVLLVTIGLVLLLYRRHLREFDERIKGFRAKEMPIRPISIPQKKELTIGLSIFGLTILSISLHHRLELLWGLEPNTLLLTIPLISAGLVMIWKWKKARSYIEHDVDWWTLLFFLLLFAQAGTLKYTGATDVLANHLTRLAKGNPFSLIGTILWTSAIGSSILDNVVLVTAFIPIIQSLHGLSIAGLKPLWWALLFGGCLGGNITMVGSTANIIALGILEKEKDIKITFFRWFWVGLTVGIITTGVAWIGLIVTS